jgi:hypothetical protein
MRTSANLLRDSIAALCGARSVACQSDMSLSLRALRLALDPLATVCKDSQKIASIKK